MLATRLAAGLLARGDPFLSLIISDACPMATVLDVRARQDGCARGLESRYPSQQRAGKMGRGEHADDHVIPLPTRLQEPWPVPELAPTPQSPSSCSTMPRLVRVMAAWGWSGP